MSAGIIFVKSSFRPGPYIDIWYWIVQTWPVSRLEAIQYKRGIPATQASEKSTFPRTTEAETSKQSLGTETENMESSKDNHESQTLEDTTVAEIDLNPIPRSSILPLCQAIFKEGKILQMKECLKMNIYLNTHQQSANLSNPNSIITTILIRE